MWLGPIQDPAFCERVLKSTAGQEGDYKTWTRIQGMVSMARDVSFATLISVDTESVKLMLYRKLTSCSTLRLIRSTDYLMLPPDLLHTSCKFLSTLR
jgi:tRNA G26 N,N-dimethylase Trm1